MIDVYPKVYMIGEPSVNVQQMTRYLEEVGGRSWLDRVMNSVDWPSGERVPDAELLTEFMGRLCYKSWEPGLNKNVTKIREDRGEYLLNILRSGHGSVLTHAWFNFVIHNGSRVFTAEMNRHAVGTAISEQSLRYVRLDDIPFWEPPGLDDQTLAEGRDLIDKFEQFYERAIDKELDDGADFATKKALTSKLRRWAPMGMSTEEGWSGNIRSIRHVIEMRTNRHAEEEIRIIADQIAQLTQDACPLLFGDYEPIEINGAQEWNTPYRKV